MKGGYDDVSIDRFPTVSSILQYPFSFCEINKCLLSQIFIYELLSLAVVGN